MSAIETPLPVTAGEPKAARKKKGKTENASTNGTTAVTPSQPTRADSDSNAASGEKSSESSYVRELNKNIRNAMKKLNGMQKAESVVAENPGLSVDELVSQKKLNPDQKAQILKKPQLKTQLAQWEEQVKHFQKIDSEYQVLLKKQKDDLEEAHTSELQKIKDESAKSGVANLDTEVRKKLLMFSRFLGAAAAKRNEEETAESDESRAFEGALLLVYGGDDTAVDTAMKLIDGSDDQVPGIDGVAVPVTFTQIRDAFASHLPFQAEEQWVDSVASANAAAPDALAAHPDSDPTIVNAGLTELNTATAQVNGSHPDTGDLTTPAQTSAANEAGNIAGDRWDTTAAGAEKSMEDSYEMIPRPSDEVDIAPPAAALSEQKTSWADDTPAVGEMSAGNKAAEAWDIKVAGEQAALDATSSARATTGSATPTPDDGFSEVPGRHRGGRSGHRGDVRGRGRGRGGPRGDGEFRGRGRGGFRGNRGSGDGEYRGRGRGRGGPRGGAGSGGAPTPSS